MKKRSRFKRFFKRYNVIPITALIILIVFAILTMFVVEQWDNKILFFIAFISLAYMLATGMENSEVKHSDKKIEHISTKSAKALKIELNKALKECQKNKYRNVDVHIVDKNNAFLIITE